MGLVDITNRLANVEAQSDYVRRWVTQNSALLSSVAAFDKRISDLEGTGETFTDILLSYASKINENGIAFLFFTDPHNMTDVEDYEMLDQLTMIRTLYENSPARYVICGGDWINTKHTLAMAIYAGGRIPNLIRNKIGERSYTVIGNHDLNVELPVDGSLTEPQLSRLWFDSDVGYYTIKTEKTECYMFDSGSQSKEMTNYRWTQVDWFANSLLGNTKPHLFGLIHIIGLNVSFETGDEPQLGENITKVADAFNRRSSITLNGQLYDFTSSVGTFHFMLAGHYHADFTRTINNIPIIYTRGSMSVDCCFVDFSESVLHMVRARMSKITTDEDRNVPIIPTGGYHVVI